MYLGEQRTIGKRRAKFCSNRAIFTSTGPTERCTTDRTRRHGGYRTVVDEDGVEGGGVNVEENVDDCRNRREASHTLSDVRRARSRCCRVKSVLAAVLAVLAAQLREQDAVQS